MIERGSAGRRHATRLLLTVSEMHKRGFQGLRIIPSMSEEPFGWHCHLVLGPLMDPGHGANGRVEMGSTLPYFSDDDGKYVWSSRPAATARELADDLENGVPFGSWLEPARIDDFAYAGWFSKLLGMAERGYLPTADADGHAPVRLFAWPDGTVPPADHTVPPAPLPPGTVGDQLIRCPDPDGPIQAVTRFALSYDAYGRTGQDPPRILQLVRPVVSQVKKDGTVPLWAGLDTLRAALFYLQREAHATEYTEPLYEREMRALARQIGLHVANRPLSDDYFGQSDLPLEPLTAGYDRRKQAERSRSA